ncbi:MAG: hypothetical protein ACUVV4_08555 [Candidatus Bathyarchaeia archaeon]
MQRNRKIVVIGAVIALGLLLGAFWVRNTTREKVKLSFIESDLVSLEGKLEILNVEDSEGLSGVGSTYFTSQDIDQLGLNLESLEFEDLEGISSP